MKKKILKSQYRKDSISFWLLIALLFVFSVRCWISIFPILNLRIFSTIFAGLSLFMPVLAFFIAITKNQVKVQTSDQRNLIIILTIYLSYCAYYIAYPQLNEPQAVPDTVGQLLFDFLPVYLMAFLSGAILEKCDITLFAKITTLTLLVFLVIYFSIFSIETYGMLYGLSSTEKEAFLSEGFFGGLGMASIVSLAYCCNLFLLDKWTNKLYWNRIITISIAIVLFYIQFMLVERGPILSLLMVTIFFFACRKISRSRNFGLLAIAAILLYFFMDTVASSLSQISGSTVQKFVDISETGGSGRFGSEAAIFPSSIRQISEGPLFGTYFRVLYGSFVNTYPHNFILEFLMTFGVVFSLPLFILMYKAVRKSYKYAGTPCFLFGLLFVNRSLYHLTSGTIIDDKLFWISFAIIMTSNYKLKKTNNIKYV